MHGKKRNILDLYSISQFVLLQSKVLSLLTHAVSSMKGNTIAINTLAEQVKQSMKSRSQITHLDPRKGDVRESSCNPNGTQNEIGFVSAVSQESGLEKTSILFRPKKDLKV